jgi:caa(3)-type oxidase subunit IV
MANSAEEVAKHLKQYFIIGTLLIVFTAITVALSYVDFPKYGLGAHSNMVIGMIVATFKSSLVMLIFMHLNSERPLVYKILMLGFLFVGVLFTLFIYANDDPLVMQGYESIFGKH